jgi:hypothetical protein
VRSFVVWRQRRVEIDVNVSDERLDTADQLSINALQPLRMMGQIASHEFQELSQYRVCFFGLLGA